MWYGSMVVYSSAYIARMLPPEHRLACLLYEEGMRMSLYPLSVCLQMDFICWCLISASAMMCGECCVERMCCRSNIVVCMPLVFRVRVVMDG
jgi:hypothetical protein